MTCSKLAAHGTEFLQFLRRISYGSGLHWKLRKMSVDKKSVFSLSVIMGNVLPGEWFDRKPEFTNENEKKKENWKITVRQIEPSPAVSVPDVNETKRLVSHGHLLDAAGNISTICWTSSFACIGKHYMRLGNKTCHFKEKMEIVAAYAGTKRQCSIKG